MKERMMYWLFIKTYPHISFITEELKFIQLCGNYITICYNSHAVFISKRIYVQDKIKQLQNKMELCNTLLGEFCFSNAI